MMKITVLGAEELAHKLEFGKFKRFVQAGLEDGAGEFKRFIAIYPPAAHRPQPFVSDRQRRGFFAKLNAGEIQVPYRRGFSPGSQRLGQSWNIRAISWHTVEVGNPATYGELVQSKDRQTRYHKTTGWNTVEAVADQKAEAITKKVNAHMAKFLNTP